MIKSVYRKKFLLEVYKTLYKEYGPQHWWPADTPFEVTIGAILTQNTSWRNVEKAINNLKMANKLTPEAIFKLSLNELEELIRPAGFFRVKARRIKEFINFLYANFNGDLRKLFAMELPSLRKTLLSVKGMGKETADSIILYSANQPSFVVDAYTRRVLYRHKFIPELNVDYDRLKSLMESNLPKDLKLYNEFHALLVKVGKLFCKKAKPLCAKGCPLLGKVYRHSE